jgi:hypothetical protein
LARRHSRSCADKAGNHAIQPNIQLGPHHIGERVDDPHERDRNFIRKTERVNAPGSLMKKIVKVSC